MTHKAAWIFGVLAIAALAGEWAGLRYFYGRSALATVECRATNAGAAIPADQVQVSIYPTGRPWELVAHGHIDETFSVRPGRYDIRLLLDASADQQSQWFREVELGEGDRVVKKAVFSAGELSVTSPTPPDSPAGQLVIYVFKPENHDQIITSIQASEVALLAAGTYDLRAVLSSNSEERGVIWLDGVEVKAGTRETREVLFHRGQLVVTARNAGEALLDPMVTVTVYRAGDDQQEIVDQGRSGSAMSLAHGRYDIELTYALSNDKPTRWLRGIEIVESETLELYVDFASGSIVVDAEITGGERLHDFEAYIYYYRAADHREPVTYTPAGETAVLESGLYDVRAHYFRSHDQPDVWLRGIQIEAGQRVHYTTTFSSGRLLVRVYDADNQERVGDEVFLYVHNVRPPGETSRPIAVARSGEQLILSSGKYDLRLLDTRSRGPAKWLKGVVVEPGERNELSVKM